jgi:hypothetical protein
MNPTLHQIKEAREVLFAEAAMERSGARRDILDAAVYGLDAMLVRRHLYHEICDGGRGSYSWPNPPFCPRCGIQHK